HRPLPPIGILAAGTERRAGRFVPNARKRPSDRRGRPAAPAAPRPPTAGPAHRVIFPRRVATARLLFARRQLHGLPHPPLRLDGLPEVLLAGEPLELSPRIPGPLSDDAARSRMALAERIDSAGSVTASGASHGLSSGGFTFPAAY